MTDKNVVLAVQNLEKSIGGKKLIHNISFNVLEGEVFGFLGPNGAGKTTTIRMLVGLIRPTAGSIQICGYDLRSQFVEAMGYVGCIVENPELYKFLTGWENLEMVVHMLDGITKERIHDVVSLVGLENRIHDKVKTYSLGMRQRLGIAQALLAKPKLLILDEPTNGLDPSGIRELREFVRKLAEQEKVSVFISSHLLSEIEMMCDRVAILHQGRCLYEGHVKELTDRGQGDSLWKAAPLENAFDLLQKSGLAENVRQEKDALRCYIPAEQIPAANKLLVDAGIQIYSIEMRSPTLEDLFLEITGGDQIA